MGPGRVLIPGGGGPVSTVGDGSPLDVIGVHRLGKPGVVIVAIVVPEPIMVMTGAQVPVLPQPGARRNSGAVHRRRKLRRADARAADRRLVSA
jgi:hypothetical protein